MAESLSGFWMTFSEWFEIGIAVLFTVVFAIAFSWVEWYRRKKIREAETRGRWRRRASEPKHCKHGLACCWGCPACPKFMVSK